MPALTSVAFAHRLLCITWVNSLVFCEATLASHAAVYDSTKLINCQDSTMIELAQKQLPLDILFNTVRHQSHSSSTRHHLQWYCADNRPHADAPRCPHSAKVSPQSMAALVRGCAQHGGRAPTRSCFSSARPPCQAAAPTAAAS